MTSRERIKHLILGLVGGLIGGVFAGVMVSALVETPGDITTIFIVFILMGALCTTRYRGGKSEIWVVLIIAFCLFILSSVFTIAQVIKETYELKGMWSFMLTPIAGCLVGSWILETILRKTLWPKTERDDE